MEFGDLYFVVCDVVCIGVCFCFFGLFVYELAYKVVLCSKAANVLIDIMTIVVTAFTLNFASILEAFSILWSCGFCGGVDVMCAVCFVDAWLMYCGWCGLFIPDGEKKTMGKNYGSA